MPFEDIGIKQLLFNHLSTLIVIAGFHSMTPLIKVNYGCRLSPPGFVLWNIIAAVITGQVGAKVIIAGAIEAHRTIND